MRLGIDPQPVQALSFNLSRFKLLPLFPPKILMLVGDRDGTCLIFNPASDYKLVVTHSNYQAAQEWLLEDEYERVKGQLLAEDVV